MAKHQSKRRSKSRGRDLKHTETQARVQVSGYVHGERGRTDGRYSLSAVAASAPSLKRKNPREHVVASLTHADITREHVPTDALAHVTRDGRIVRVDYHGEPRVREHVPTARDTYSPLDGAHTHGTHKPRALKNHGLGIATDAIKELERNDKARTEQAATHGTFTRTERAGYLVRWLREQEQASTDA